MAYDEFLADRVRRLFKGTAREQKMFGGLAFLVDGKMACGVLGDRLIVKVGKEGHGAAMRRPHVAPFDFTGRPMQGILYVKPAGVSNAAALRRWVELGRKTALAAKKTVRKRKRSSAASFGIRRRRRVQKRRTP